MSEVKARQEHPPEFKAKVGLEALRGVKTINEMGQEHGVHPVQVGQWKKAIQEQAKTLFEGKRGPKPVAAHREPEVWYSEVGKLKIELDWRKKIPDQPVLARRAWIEPEEGVPVVQPCVLAGACRGHDPCATKATDRRSSRPAAHEPVGTLRPSAGSAHPSAAPGAPGLSLPAAWGGGGPAQAGLEQRHHVHSGGAWLGLAGGDHRQVVPQSPQLAPQQHPGSGVLYRVPGGSPAHSRQAGDLQQRSRRAVYQRSLHQRPDPCRDRHQQRWTGTSIPQPLR